MTAFPASAPTSKLQLLETRDDEIWDAWNAQSPQGTLFSTSLFLRAAQVRHRRFFICKGEETKAAFCLCESEDGKLCVADDLVIHSGLFFAPDPSPNQAAGRRERFAASECLIRFLVENYDSVELPLSPGVEDLRPFLWHEYHGPPENRFRLELKYTSYLRIGELAQSVDDEETSLFRNLESRRRRNLRDARKQGALVEYDCPRGTLLSFYRKLMTEQQSAPEESKLKRIGHLIDTLTEQGKARSFLVRSAEGETLYAAAFAWDDRHRAYYLFGGGETDPSRKRNYQGTYLFWEAMRSLARDQGIDEIDWEGVNSPSRGWFKLGFGGDVRPYHFARRSPLHK